MVALLFSIRAVSPRELSALPASTAYNACMQENLSIGINGNNHVNRAGFLYDAAINLTSIPDSGGLRFIGILQSLVVTMGLLLCSPGYPASQTTKYDGHWWLLLTSEEKSGYLNGDADCHTFELKAKPRYSKSAADEQESVTNFYRDEPDKRSLPVFEAIRIVEDEPPLRETGKGGEVWTEPHGYWDGQWWREGSPADRLGFVEGYLACHSRSQRPHGALSRTPPEYARLINQWYKLNEETGDVEPDRVDTKIADVLFKFRDRTQRPRSKNK